MKTLYNFLDPDTIKMAVSEVESLKHSNTWRTSNNVWPKDLTYGAVIGTVAQAFVSEELEKKVINLIRPHVPECNIIKVQHYLWYPLSGINLHSDGKTIFGATIYLTPRWDINWGGLFVYESPDGLRANFPVFNSITLNTEGIQHMVTTVSPLAPYPRYTLQIWGE